MRILVTGGGTGGHVYPALAVLDSFRRRAVENGEEPPAVLWVGTDRKEAQILPKLGIELRKVDIYPFRRSVSLRSLAGNFKLALNLLTGKAEKQAARHITDFKPDFVLSTGGYVAYPACRAAIHAHVPIFQLEPNATPGLVTRKIAARAATTFCSTRECALELDDAPTEVTGIPVRSYSAGLEKRQILSKYGLEPGRRTVLVTGGSLGSSFLNKLIFGTIVELIDADESLRNTTQVIHQVGGGSFDVAKNLSKDLKFPYKPVEYFDDMPEVLFVADMLISRSGASAVAEAVHFGIPSLFFPYIHHADKQQVKNVMPLVHSRVCEMYIESEFDSAMFEKDFLELLNACTNPELRARIKEFDSNAADTIAGYITDNLNKRIHIDNRETHG